MLASLSIRDVVLIDRLDLEFRDGLCVLTGETGAGKSILLDALGLALGARGNAALVRDGAEQAAVSAAFQLAAAHPVFALLTENDLAIEDDQLVLRRVFTADGRSRAYVNDQPVSVGLLRQAGELLVEIEGQFEEQGLLKPGSHRDVLDNFGHLEADAARVRALHAAWREAAQARAAAAAEVEQARREEEFLRHAHDELAELDPQTGEEPVLAERRQLLRHGEALVEAVNEAAGELARSDGVDTALRLAMRHLERHAEKAGGIFDTALAALDRAAVESAEAQAQIEALTEKIDLDPRELDKVEERLFALRGLARKHNTETDALPALLEDFARQLSRIEESGGELAALEAAETAAEAAYRQAAEALGKARRKAADGLDATVMAELPPLKLEKARFVTEIVPLDPEDWGPAGGERVQFMIATNPGVKPGALNRIASGGELSRFMLALKVATSRDSSVPTLVFDEVDSGIGGATAAAVGERLARLAGDVQVLVITHSPQVAALGAAHWRIAKATAKDATVTRVEGLDEDGRLEEVARMLAGADVTDEARAAAKRLMAGSAAS